MPERPDLDYALPILKESLQSARIAEVELHKPPVLRLAVEGSVQDALVGREICDLRRHLHFVCFDFGPDAAVEMVIAPMLAGNLSVHPPKEGNQRDRALTLTLEDGRELRYRDSKAMGKVYVIPAGRHELIARFDPVGLDLLDPEVFTWEAFSAIARKRRDQVKVFLLDKSALDSLGNAYADEALFEAGLHPKTFVRKLSEAQLRRLHAAIPAVLRAANREIQERAPATDTKIRDFLKVRGRHKEPCLRCQSPIRKAGVRGHDAYFCPECQPETRKSGIVSWGSKA
jgi:formamidopyrimidine-DNA glycosylase